MRKILLTQGKVALVDDADFGAVNAFGWCAAKLGRGFYAVRNVQQADGSRATQYMHQFLLPGVPRLDHRDGNGLNNQRDNLRPATARQNQQGFQRKRANTSAQFRGVTLHFCGKWQARIGVNGKKIHLGYSRSETDAAKAYDDAARKTFGEFASPNFPVLK